MLYCIAGGFATASHYATTVLAVEVGGVLPLFASMLGFAVGANVKYALNYFFTFRSTAAHGPATVRFGGLLAILFVLNAAIFYALNDLAGLHYALAQVIATIALIPLGYLIARFWVFPH